MLKVRLNTNIGWLCPECFKSYLRHSNVDAGVSAAIGAVVTPKSELRPEKIILIR